MPPPHACDRRTAFPARRDRREAAQGAGGTPSEGAPRSRVMRNFVRYQAGPLAGVIAFVYLWYLQYKFLGHEGSVQLFTTLTDWLHLHGHEKAMRIGVGSAELVASILLLVPATQVLGAALSFCIITGAIFFHLVSPLGV